MTLRWMAIALAIAACGKSGTSSNGSAATPAGAAPAGSATASSSGALTGTWTGAWKRTEPVPGGGKVVLAIGATTTLTRSGTACPPDETPATVSVDGDKVTIEVNTPEVKVTYRGTRTGTQISGDLTTTCKIGTGTGTFTLSAP